MKNDDAQLESNQKSNWGGARPNSGRPKGSTNKLKIADFFSPDEIDRVVAEAKLLAFGDANNKPDKQVLIFVLEQLFGKATQRQEHSGADGQPLVVALAETILQKHALNPKTERDSEGQD